VPDLVAGARAHRVLALALSVGSLLCMAATALPAGLSVGFEVLQAVVMTLFVGAFLVLGVALLRALLSEHGRSVLGTRNAGNLGRFLRGLPRGLQILHAVLLCLAALGLTVVTRAGPGQVEQDGRGGYFAVHAGGHEQERAERRAAITQAEYDTIRRAGLSRFAAGAAALYAMGSLLVLASAGRTRAGAPDRPTAGTRPGGRHPG
jgi:hypothetical protein